MSNSRPLPPSDVNPWAKTIEADVNALLRASQQNASAAQTALDAANAAIAALGGPATPTLELGVVALSFAAVYASASTALTPFMSLDLPASTKKTLWVIDASGFLGFNSAASEHAVTMSTSAGTLTVPPSSNMQWVQAAAGKFGLIAQVYRLESDPGISARVTFSARSNLATGDNYAMFTAVATPNWI